MSITDTDIEQALRYDTLGPAYFAARRVAEQLMKGAESDPFQKVASKVIDQIRDAVYEYVEDHIRSDMESNLQSHLVDKIDSTVAALLTGNEWAMSRYPLSKRYDAVEVRAACAKHGGEPLLMARIADLEKRVSELTESLRFEQDCRRY